MHDAELRVLSPRASFLYHSSFVRLWGKRSRRHHNNSKQRQPQPHIFVVTVTVVTLGRSLYYLPCRLLGCQRSFYRLLILLASHRIHEPQSTCILPELVRYTATSKGYNSEYTPWTTSTARSYAALWSQDPAARSCSINSSTVSATVHILKKNMQKIQKTTVTGLFPSS